MTNTTNVNYKFLAIPLAVMLATTILSGSFIITAYAQDKKVGSVAHFALARTTWD